MKLSEFKVGQRLLCQQSGLRALVCEVEHDAVFLFWQDMTRGWRRDNFESLYEHDGDCPFVVGDLIEGRVIEKSWQGGNTERWEPLQMVHWHPDGRITVHLLSGNYRGNDTVTTYNPKMFRKKK